MSLDISNEKSDYDMRSIKYAENDRWLSKVRKIYNLFVLDEIKEDMAEDSKEKAQRFWLDDLKMPPLLNRDINLNRNKTNNTY